ncbi:hypothetical protein B0F90DRAFT_1810834 [Multifurca ochricompacta]|uniref:Uncharacterized protein n=1 Tax=Multifurca ochricompacta TaxID=376703 RepID=A0AAD4M1F9_9AGAM|nr:hypothetical protein B0F90DRAFT_1810834 [Multifurca ochricompacta]
MTRRKERETQKPRNPEKNPENGGKGEVLGWTLLAGDFDPRPPRDVLTSLLNGVPRYTLVESVDDLKREKRRFKKIRERVKKRAKSPQNEPANDESDVHHDTLPSIADTILHSKDFLFDTSSSSAWGCRPVLRLATTQRSVSVTPPPMPSSPPTTPGPSISSSTSRTSSKRPHTPEDDSDLDDSHADIPESSLLPRPRKKRPAARKGWKGWVEGSPPPSEKLINLDAVQVLEERRTRSGKSFDAIGLGKDSWV